MPVSRSDDARRRLQLSSPHLLAVRWRLHSLVLLVGLLGGVAGALYLAVLAGLQSLLWPEHHTSTASLAILTGVGLAIGLMTRYVGNPGDVELLVNNIHVIGRPERPRSLLSLIPVSLLGIAAGGAAGPEAPLVQTTGTLGSSVGRWGRRSPDDVRVLAITGMAAGFTVLFGTPLGAAIFALEILHRRGMEYYEALLPAIIGSLFGYAVSVLLGSLGLQPIFDFPATPELVRSDLLWAVGAGVVGASVAAAFTFLVKGLRRLFGPLPIPVRPMIGGVVLGLLGLLTPYALTFGEEQVNPLIAGAGSAAVFALAAGGKLVASAVTVTSGWRGGFIIPLFFVGAALGQLGALELAGVSEVMLMAALMASINAGVTKTPLGSTIVVSEMAGVLVLPTTLIATVVSLFLTSGTGVIASQRERTGSLDAGRGDGGDGGGRSDGEA